MELKLNLQWFGDDDPIEDEEPAKLYKIVETTTVIVNDEKTELIRNMTIRHGVTGAIVGVDCEGEELELSDDIIGNLLKSGAIEEIVTAEEDADDAEE